MLKTFIKLQIIFYSAVYCIPLASVLLSAKISVNQSKMLAADWSVLQMCKQLV